jgi:hypothetical protein
MPMEGFAAMFVFFEAQLGLLIQNGHITEKRLAEMRAAFSSGQKP